MFGVLVLLYGALGVAQAAQHAMAQVWNVPGVDPARASPGSRAGLLFFADARRRGWSAGAALSVLTTGSGNGVAVRIASLARRRAVLNVVLFVGGVPPPHPEGRPVGGVAPRRGRVGGIGVHGAAHDRDRAGAAPAPGHAHAVYGQFAMVLGLLAWLFLVVAARALRRGAQRRARTGGSGRAASRVRSPRPTRSCSGPWPARRSGGRSSVSAWGSTSRSPRGRGRRRRRAQRSVGVVGALRGGIDRPVRCSGQRRTTGGADAC